MRGRMVYKEGQKITVKIGNRVGHEIALGFNGDKITF
jgi:hypothetical protein